MLNKLQIVEGIKAGAFFGDDLGKGNAKNNTAYCNYAQRAKKIPQILFAG